MTFLLETNLIFKYVNPDMRIVISQGTIIDLLDIDVGWIKLPPSMAQVASSKMHFIRLFRRSQVRSNLS